MLHYTVKYYNKRSCC